jgi:hypothetical protein
VLVGSGGAAGAATFTYTALNTDGAYPAYPLGINAQDEVVGYATNKDNGMQEGFIWIAGTLANIKGSGALYSINDSGIAVGSILGESKAFVSYDVTSGVLTDIPITFARGEPEVAPSGINSSGEVVGTVYYVNKKAELFGFVYLNGTTTKLLPPNETQSNIASINKKAEMLIDGGATYYNPFLYRKGKFTQIAVPGASITTGSFITDGGVIGGNYTSGSSTSGFVLNGTTYTTYSPFGSTNSIVTGIGPSSQVYGTFVDTAGIPHGFVNVNGDFYQIDIPGSTDTLILGVSSSGSIFGLYGDSQGSYGYIGKCPKKDVCTQ